MQLVYSTSVSGGGLSLSPAPTPLAVESASPFELAAPAAAAGTLSTRNDANTGVLTISGTTLQTNDVVDVYWAAGRRSGMTVTGVSGSAVTVDGGSGTDLPTANTAITAAKQETANVVFSGAELQYFAIMLETPAAAVKARCEFLESDDTSIVAYALTGNAIVTANVAGGDTNPFTGVSSAKIVYSNGGTSAGVLKILVGLNVST